VGETNRRTDGYGGDDIRDRARFPAEIVREVRAAVGPDYPISLRFSQWKEVNYDARVVETPADLAAMLRIFEEAGADMLPSRRAGSGFPNGPCPTSGSRAGRSASRTCPSSGSAASGSTTT
jgi:2,4-dienoyl-CoA reductase-like NADH-dependent reductase (Old Yellow Enzyme family)